mgnify:CR=1 FL=1
MKVFEDVSPSESVALKPLDKRQSAPKFELKDANGAKVTIEEYKGKVVLLNFWATWCEPCREEMPAMQRLEKRFAGRPFTILAVNVGEGEARIQEFLDTLVPQTVAKIPDVASRAKASEGIRAALAPPVLLSAARKELDRRVARR